MSIRYKIALLFAGMVSLLLLCLGTATYFIAATERNSLFDTRLRNRATATVNTIMHMADGNYNILRTLDTSSVASLQNKSTVVLDYDGRVVYAYTDHPGNEIILSPRIIEQTKISGEYFFRLPPREAVAVHLVTADRNFIVAVAAEDIDGIVFLRGLRTLLIWVFVVAVLLSFLAGYLFARALLRPLGRIIREVKLVSSQNLSHRFQAGPGQDELQELSRTFNELLDKIEESFVIQRRFISNASHELSTPLTAVSSQLEVALQKDRSEDEYRQVLRSIYEDVRGLLDLTRSLLEIAKSGSLGSLELTALRIDEVLMRVASDVQKLRSDYTVQLNFETLPENEQLLTVYGNAELLYMAFRNVVENGCKYAFSHTAFISVSFEAGTILVAVKSTGATIPAAELTAIFQPFYRSESAGQQPGFGLGLTLTRRILSLHKSTIGVTSDDLAGTLFTIRLPSCVTG